VVAKVEWYQGELFPRVGFVVTNLRAKPQAVVEFYNRRGTAEQWIKEGKYALHWTRLSCHRFVANQVRLAPGDYDLRRRRIGSFAYAQAGLCLLSPQSCHTYSIRDRIFFRNLPVSGLVS